MDDDTRRTGHRDLSHISGEDTLKGDARLQLLLEFLGGTVGDETMRFSEVPTFEVGERAVLFVHTRDLMVSPPSGQRRQPSRGHQPGGRGCQDPEITRCCS